MSISNTKRICFASFVCVVLIICVGKINKKIDLFLQIKSSQNYVLPFPLEEHLRFLPYGYGDIECAKLLKTMPKFSWPMGYEEAAKDHKAVLRKAVRNQQSVEGHSGQILEQQMVYVKLAQLPFVETICETGFNAGHSTLIWLAAKATTKVYSFDLGTHDYGKTMAQYLQNKYPDRLTVTWGDSTMTLPNFLRTHQDVKCDLLVVDGGHTVPIATADLMNFRQMASTSNIVVFDDYPTKRNWRDLASVWESQVRNGTLSHQYACQKNNRAFALGHYLVF